jgi:hypothetical protein
LDGIHGKSIKLVPNGRLIGLNRVFEEGDINYPARPKPDPPASAGASKKKKGEAADRSEVEKSEIAPRMKIVTKRRRQNLGAATLYAFDQARRKLLLLRGHWRRREAHEAIEKTFFLGTARRSFWFVCWRKSSCC